MTEININIKKVDDLIVVEIVGDLNNDKGCDKLKNEIDSIIRESTNEEIKLIIDLQNIRKIGSLGLAAIIYSYTKLKSVGKLKLVDPNKKILTLLRTTHLDSIMSYHESLQSAKQDF